MAFLAIMVTTLFACSHMPQEYKPNPPDPNVKSTGLRIAVVELEDRNPEDEKASGLKALLIQLPLVPYVSFPPWHYVTPIASCLADELRESGVFAHVDYFESWGSDPRQFSEYDVLVTGTLVRNGVSHTMTAYGLGSVGVYLWLLGIPVGFLDREVVFDIDMIDPKFPYSPTLVKSIQFQQRKWVNFYSAMSQDAAYRESLAAGFRLNFADCPSAELNPILKGVPFEIAQASYRMKTGVQVSGHNQPSKGAQR